MFSLFTLLTLAASMVSALDSVTVKGNAFFVGDQRIYVKGVDYQPGGLSKLADPLADIDALSRDIKLFKDLGINSIRVYSVDNTVDHKSAMKLLEDAGIYVFVDVNIPKASISRADAKCSYNSAYLNEVFATVQEFAKYTNTWAFYAANEVINDDKTTETATYVKAVVRDMKLFMDKNKLRMVPTGYSAADVESNRYAAAEFFNCGDDKMARLDFFAFNDYSWCGSGSSFEISGYKDKVALFKNYSIPLFFSEFGCNTVRPRTFDEVELIYSTQMSSVFSGGLVYEYSEEPNKYGLVELLGSSANPNDDYKNLKKKFASAKFPSGDGGYQSGNSPASCPAISDVWNATSTLPNTPKEAMKYIDGSLKPSGKGFKADTQWNCPALDVGSSSSSGSSSGSSGSGSGSSSGSNGSSGSKSSSKKSGANTPVTSGMIETFMWLMAAGAMAFFA